VLLLMIACAPETAPTAPELGPLAADAGFDLIGQPGTDFVFDGSDSRGPDLSFQWRLSLAPEDSRARLEHPDTAWPALLPDEPGLYELELEVCDAVGRCATDSAMAIVSEFQPTSGSAPVADAGSDVTGAAVGSGVSLDGSGTSDPEGDSLTYVWSFGSQPSSSTLTKSDISGRFGTSPSFTPDVEGVYKLRLYVTDGTGASQDSVRVITSGNTGPTADAGADSSGTTGTSFSLDASGSSDPQGDDLYIKWAFASMPATSGLANSDIGDRFASSTSFTPDVQGPFEVKLVIDDYGGNTDKDFVTQTAVNTGNSAPSADAGSDQTGTISDSYTLDASASSDTDGDPLSYRWVLVGAPGASGLTNKTAFGGRFSSSTSFSPDVVGVYEVKVKVNDGAEEVSDSLTVGVSVVGNSAPVADAGADLEAILGDLVSMDGTGTSDADGDSLTYRWNFDSVPGSSGLVTDDITDRLTRTPDFSPDVAGTYTLKLAVEDYVSIDRDYVDVVVYATNYDDDIQPIFDAECTSCHSGASPSANLDLSDSSEIIDVASDDVPSMDRVEPGDTSNSYLWHKIKGTHGSVGGAGSTMPRGGGSLTSAEISLIGDWIDEGAPDL
jgi:hypothetical protein